MSTINPGNFTSEPLADAVEEPAPIIIDLGRHKPKAVKNLKKGRGKLLDEIYTTIEELRTVGAISATAQPVIVVVEEKPTIEGLFPMLRI